MKYQNLKGSWFQYDETNWFISDVIQYVNKDAAMVEATPHSGKSQPSKIYFDYDILPLFYLSIAFSKEYLFYRDILDL